MIQIIGLVTAITGLLATTVTLVKLLIHIRNHPPPKQ